MLAVLVTYVGGLGPLLGPMLAVLERSWGLRCRSWAALGAYVGGLGAYVGGLGPLLGPMLAVLGALGPKCGPSPSGKSEMWHKPERGQGPKGCGLMLRSANSARRTGSAWGPGTHLFCRYVFLLGPY